MKMNTKIKSRQLRAQYDFEKIKNIAKEMIEKKQLGLKIEKKKLGVKSLTFLENFTHLEKLTIYDISKDISTISQMVSLKQLALCGLKLNNLDFLINLPKLEYLWFQGSTLKDYNSFKPLKNLKAIKLFGLRKIEDISFFENMISLQYINITNCSNIIEFPNLNKLKHLRRTHLDTMMRLKDISGIAKAPNLESVIIINTKELKADCLDSFNNLKPPFKILIGNSKLAKHIPENIKMDEFYGSNNEYFELK